MKRTLLALLLASTATTSYAFDFGGVEYMTKAGSHMAAALDEWNSHTGYHDETEEEFENESRDVQDAPTATFEWGWCNELVVWAFSKSGQWHQVGIIPSDGHSTMRGRDWTSARNENVDQSWDRHDMTGDDIPWDDVPRGSVVMLDWSGSKTGYVPGHWGAMGIDHVTLYLGPSDKSGYGWFLGGNQSGLYLPKEYELADATFISYFEDHGEYEDLAYYDWETEDYLKLEEGDWNEESWSSMSGSKWKAKNDNSNGYHNASDDEKINMQKFRKSGTDEEVFLIGEEDVTVYNDYLISSSELEGVKAIYEDLVSYMPSHFADIPTSIYEGLDFTRASVLEYGMNPDSTMEFMLSHRESRYPAIRDGYKIWTITKEASDATEAAILLNNAGYDIATHYLPDQGVSYSSFATAINDMMQDANGDLRYFSLLHREAGEWWDARSGDETGLSIHWARNEFGELQGDTSWRGLQQEYMAIKMVTYSYNPGEPTSMEWAQSVADKLEGLGYTQEMIME